MVVPGLSGHAAYKKNDGILSLSADLNTVAWTPNRSGPAALTIAVANLFNLQQTPESNPRVCLKLFARPATEGEDPESWVFHFNSAAGRAEANSIKAVLSNHITEMKANDPSVPRPVAAAVGADGAPGTPAAAAAAATAAAAAAASSSARWFDDARLKADMELQHSLMKTDKALHQMYMNARESKPDSISDAAFNSQFWATRTGLLRAHAIETSQRRGPYNVLSAVKPQAGSDGSGVEQQKVNISVDQIQLILAQHPLVRRIYDETVPRTLSEGDFWSRFFVSRLCKTLRGERTSPGDHAEPLFDQHDAREDTAPTRITSARLPHLIDVAANEQNQGGTRTGNRKDVDMRPRSDVPLLFALNSISEKIMAKVAPTDVGGDDSDRPATDTAASGDVDYQTHLRELALRDLQGPGDEHRIMLNVKEQTRFFASRSANDEPSARAAALASQDPAQALAAVSRDLQRGLSETAANGVALHDAIGIDNESDSEDEQPAGKRKRPHVGSRASLRAARRDLMAGITRRRGHEFGSAGRGAGAGEEGGGQISSHIAEQCAVTQATTVEFLHQFWNAFLSGDPDRAPELQHLAESLRRSEERIAAVAETAERAREEEITRRKKEIRSHFERTGRKIRWRAEGVVAGGRDAVVAALGSTIAALGRAQEEYRRAYEAGMAEMAATTGAGAGAGVAGAAAGAMSPALRQVAEG